MTVTRELSVKVDEVNKVVTLSFNLRLGESVLEVVHTTSLPLTEDKISQFLSRVKSAIQLDEKMMEMLTQVISVSDHPQRSPQQPSIFPEPPKSNQTLDVIITKLRGIYPCIPSDVIDRVVGMVADKCEIPRERFFKLSSDEFDKLHSALFLPVGEEGVRHVLLVETIVKGNYEVPTNPEERKILLAQAREFVRTHPILSQCEENVNQARIDTWRGAFLALYEIYRLENH